MEEGGVWGAWAGELPPPRVEGRVLPPPRVEGRVLTYRDSDLIWKAGAVTSSVECLLSTLEALGSPRIHREGVVVLEKGEGPEIHYPWLFRELEAQASLKAHARL